MAAKAYAGASTVGDGTAAILVEFLGDVVQVMASAYSGLPVVAIHVKVLEVPQVNDKSAVVPADAIVPR